MGIKRQYPVFLGSPADLVTISYQNPARKYQTALFLLRQHPARVGLLSALDVIFRDLEAVSEGPLTFLSVSLW